MSTTDIEGNTEFNAHTFREHVAKWYHFGPGYMGRWAPWLLPGVGYPLQRNETGRFVTGSGHPLHLALAFAPTATLRAPHRTVAAAAPRLVPHRAKRPWLRDR